MTGKNNIEKLNGSDASGLLDSINGDCSRTIDELNRKAEEEIDELRKTAEEEIEEYRKRETGKTDAELEAEIAMLRNRAAIEKRKIRMNMIDSFISSMIKQSLETLMTGHSDLYREFIMQEVLEALGLISGEARVILSGRDRDLGGEIKKMAEKQRGAGVKTLLVFDESNKEGGAVVMDVEKGILYNSTLERILFRLREKLRRQAAEIISGHGFFEGQF